MNPTIDDILASGRYVDRQGRLWYHDKETDTWACIREDGGLMSVGPVIDPPDMRLKVTRDLHRAECPGLKDCIEHPVPHVVADEDRWRAYSSRRGPYVHQRTLSEALDAAVRLAKEGR